MKKIISILLSFILIMAVGCTPKETEKEPPFVRVNDERNLSAADYTVNNISATDREGRTVRTSDTEEKEKDIGLFYHIWQGHHTNTYKHINDITKLLNENPDALYDIDDNAASPLDEFYFWGEPLYGYYCSYDPYVINRHVELFTMAGVDYLIYDLTNSVIYYKAMDEIFKVLQHYYDLGWDVPKVAFYTNSYSAATVRSVYNNYYAKNKYPNLWYSPQGKPLIVGRRAELGAGSKDAEILEFFDFKESQWPNGETSLDLENGFPWMEWEFPQRNFNGVMSVSLAQHLNARMSEMSESNNGRGYDFKKLRNYSKNSSLGTNFSGQFDTVFENNSDSTKQKVNNVFITGFNEWQAIKKQDGNKVFFVDTFNEEYSRDIEMMKGGYEDNFYLQMADLIKRFKYTPAKHYILPQNTIDIKDESFKGWNNVKSVFKDFEGDAISRDFADAFSTKTYKDNSNRNDISNVSITHDENNLYIKVDTVENITPHAANDLSWMNLMIKTDEDLTNTFHGFKYFINRKPTVNGKTSIEQSTGGYAFKDSGSADYVVKDNSILFSIPLSSLGLTAEKCFIQFKVSDNVTSPDDIMDYYVTGDSAPIGRLSYTYGY